MTKQGVSRISISLPPDLLQDFEQVVGEMDFDRSKAIQQAIRDFLTEYRWERDDDAYAVGTITLIFNHEIQGLESELTATQHHHPDVIMSTTHVHLNNSHCLLVIVVKGKATEIKELAVKLKGLRGVQQLKLTSLLGAPPTKHSHSH
jgi:CopG family nickel-responsive transcriptional regulator